MMFTRLILLTLALIASVLSAGCRPICEGVDGACLALQLTGLGRYEDLLVQVQFAAPKAPLLLASVAGPFDLPLLLRVLPPDEHPASAFYRLELSAAPAQQPTLRTEFLPLCCLDWADDAHIDRTFQLIAIAPTN